MSPVRHQAIIPTNIDLLSSESLGINLTEIRIKLRHFEFKKMSSKWRACDLGLNFISEGYGRPEHKQTDYIWYCAGFHMKSNTVTGSMYTHDF